jgi:hypothetical protein
VRNAGWSGQIDRIERTRTKYANTEKQRFV